MITDIIESWHEDFLNMSMSKLPLHPGQRQLKSILHQSAAKSNTGASFNGITVNENVHVSAAFSLS